MPGTLVSPNAGLPRMSLRTRALCGTALAFNISVDTVTRRKRTDTGRRAGRGDTDQSAVRWRTKSHI